MGMKLKSGADLCGFELSRFCVQNDVAIPDAPASGRKYFHTGTGMEGKYSLLGRERIFTGAAWRAAAYVDDLANLDLATNEDYLKLKEKVDLLSGEVDTDAIINNMKEVTAFLSGFAEDASLMDLLNSKFDKKGGTITGSLVKRTTGQNYITFEDSDGNAYGYLGFNGANTPMYMPKEANAIYTLIHSGNVGEYAVKTKGDSTIVDGSLSFQGGYIKFLLSDGSLLGGFNVSGNTGNPVFLTRDGNWKTIAFTDSTVEAAKRLETPRTIWGQSFDGTGNVTSPATMQICHFANNGESIIGYVGKGGTSTNHIYLANYTSDGEVRLFTDSNTSKALILNSSGNVTIGRGDLAGTSATAKLYVDGYVTTKDGVVINAADAYNSYWEKGFLFSSNSALNAGLWGYGYKSLEYLYLGFGNYSAAVGIRINENGNVGIGTSKPSAQLHVSQDIVANGTIACKGVAAEGSAPVGTVDKWAGSIASGTKSQTYTHGLGTTDITVAIYEKNGNEWVQILTDVDIVNANTIRVTFGANTTVEHRIVVMG